MECIDSGRCYDCLSLRIRRCKILNGVAVEAHYVLTPTWGQTFIIHSHVHVLLVDEVCFHTPLGRVCYMLFSMSSHSSVLFSCKR